MLYDELDLVDKDSVVSFVKGLQQPDGSFMGDKWGKINYYQFDLSIIIGEIDTRFSFCAIATLSLIVRLL